jgi:ankyrin repeat protein
MRAARNGHTDTVNALAGTHNANVEAVDEEGWTALMLAAHNGHTDTVNALAGTHNANVEAVDASRPCRHTDVGRHSQWLRTA